MVLDCTARGKSGHAARGEGVNAIYAALPAIEWFRSYQFPKVSPWLGPVGMNVTMIQAGTQHNVVPDACSFVVDVRPNGMYTNPELLSLIRAALPAIEIRARSTRLGSSHLPESSAVVRRGLSMGLEAFGSPTCSNQTLCSFPTLKIGPGDSARSHTADEFICLSEIREGIDIFVRLLDQLEL
jgi:acetylornithine deacetylase